MHDKYVAPEYKLSAFHCPYCNVFAQQIWWNLRYNRNWEETFLSDWKASKCDHCWNFSMRGNNELIYPTVSVITMPHLDMPDTVKELYNEARDIAWKSPRAAAALLRLALEKLTEELWETNWKLNTRIGNLKKKWLPEKAIQALDIVRITANEWGSHLGQIDLTGSDNADLVNQLFFLLNFIVEHVITVNNQLDAMYAALPEDKKKGIENRDNQS